MAVNHEELVREIDVVAALPIEERLQRAKLRRQQQINTYMICCNETNTSNQQQLEPERELEQKQGRPETVTSRQSYNDNNNYNGNNYMNINNNKINIATTSAKDEQRGEGGGRRGPPVAPRSGSTRRRRGRRAVAFTDDVTVFEAAGRNDIQEVLRLVTKPGGCGPNVINRDGLSLIHKCCIDGLEELLSLLITELKADVNIKDEELWTPLHTAALCRQTSICRILIERGADLLAMTVDGNMPYDVCDDDDTLDVIEAEMVKRNVTQEKIESLRGTTERAMLNELHYLFTDGYDIEVRGPRGETPLHIAAANGYIMVASFLLTDGGSSVDAVDDEGWQPIHCAAHWRQLAVLELLMIHGAQPDALTDDHQTPLDLVNDAELQQWILTVKSELEKELGDNQSTADLLKIVSESRINNSSFSLNGSIYCSNLSLADKTLLRKMNGKESNEALTKKDARLEARLRGVGERPYHSAPSLLQAIDDSDGEEVEGRMGGEERLDSIIKQNNCPPSAFSNKLQVISKPNNAVSNDGIPGVTSLSINHNVVSKDNNDSRRNDELKFTSEHEMNDTMIENMYNCLVKRQQMSINGIDRDQRIVKTDQVTTRPMNGNLLAHTSALTQSYTYSSSSSSSTRSDGGSSINPGGYKVCDINGSPVIADTVLSSKVELPRKSCLSKKNSTRQPLPPPPPEKQNLFDCRCTIM